jgi:hypothetical protein
MKRLFISLVLAAAFGAALQPAHAQLSSGLVAALIVKVTAFERNANASDVTVYVVNAPNIAAELKKSVGSSVGGARLASVNSGSSLPSSKPSVIFVNDAAKAGEVASYAQKNKVLSMTDDESLLGKGIAVGFGLAGGKTKITINMSASSAASLNWNGAIFKIASRI